MPQDNKFSMELNDENTSAWVANVKQSATLNLQPLYSSNVQDTHVREPSIGRFGHEHMMTTDW